MRLFRSCGTVVDGLTDELCCSTRVFNSRMVKKTLQPMR